MAKTETIIVRVDAAVKGRIEAAARRSGKSITTFILEAAEKAAEKVEAMPTKSAAMMKPKGKGACPTYFLALCMEARQGGESSYADAGHELMRHVASELNHDLELDETQERLDQLRELVQLRDDKSVLAWFARELPRCMKLVPARRRLQFLKGAYEMYDKDDGVLLL
jgi:hypothetical protein